MSKDIETIVDDIYGLFSKEGGTEVPNELAEEFGNAMANLIVSRLREVKGDGVASLRPSNLGKKDRQLWYTLHGFKGEDLSPQAKIKFLYGDILEQLLILFCKLAGHEVKDLQKTRVLAGVKGSSDLTLDGHIVDCKSASSYSFKKFEDGSLAGNDPFGYIDQLGFYKNSDPSNEKYPAFLVIDKTLGKICLCPINNENLPDTRARILRAREIEISETPPERCFNDLPEGASGNRILCMECSYCQFKHHCWPGLRTFLYSTGPKFLTQVVKEPKVPEANSKEDFD